ncbi:MAG: [protein-PII] uridylyltransferase [Pseudomonadota bacterium]
MTVIAAKKGRLVNPDFLQKQLAEIAESHGDASSFEARAQVLSVLKDTLLHGRAEAERLLLSDGKGVKCAQRISDLQDVIIQSVYQFALREVFKASNLSKGEKLTLVALGGYGRGTLAPGSDIDLLFLLPYKKTPLSEQVTEYILYILWDLGQKVGHATRTVDECIKLSKTDPTICTSILEARHLTGDDALYETLMERFQRDVVRGTAAQYIQAKMDERDLRHRRMGEARYVLQPNVKEGKGGLRDLHTLFWIAKYTYQLRNREDLVKVGVLAKDELRLFVKSEDFLWTVRCHLHFETGKAEERLAFDLQRALARRLSYQSHNNLQDVERFMKHYFLVTKDVGDLTRIFSAVLEDQEIKQAPMLSSLLAALPFSGGSKTTLRGIKDFVADRQRINVVDDDVFDKDPVNLIRMFNIAERFGLEYHPHALKLARASLKRIDKTVRKDVNANRLFLSLLTSRNDPEINLRRMNEVGVLGRFIPDFSKIVAMMQFNMYHSYTVDEHLIQTVGTLAKIESGVLKEEHPLAAELVPDLSDQDRQVLYVALLLHDIAKGRPQDHSTAGAAVARRLCPRLGLNPDQVEIVAWLVQEHLTMSMIAQSRDLSDRKTIEDFIGVVQSTRRLKLLLILTVCDIRAVGPGVWNGWKGQLLRTLYSEAELALTGGFSPSSRSERARNLREKLVSHLAHWPGDEAVRYGALHYDNYLLSVSLEDQLRHAEFIKDANEEGVPLATMVNTNSFQAVTEIVVLAQDHPRLLSVVAAACSGSGAEIDGAQIFTTSDGRALDIIQLHRAFKDDDDELRRARSIGKNIEDMLLGKLDTPTLLSRPHQLKKLPKTFRVAPKVAIDNSLSNMFTVLEVEGLDRPGLLSQLTELIAGLQLDIRSAHVMTFGERIIDSFYVTDLVGQKIVDPGRQARIRSALLRLMEARSDRSGRAA